MAVDKKYVSGRGGYYDSTDNSGPYAVASDGTATLVSGGGGGGGGGDASAANQVAGNATLTAISGKLPTTLGAKTAALSLSVVPATDAKYNTLAQPSIARQLAADIAGGASANVALTAAVRRISIVARGSDLRYAIGSAAATASATTHLIMMNERLDLAVPTTPNIAVLSDSATAGSLEITELV